ncbi:expressed unknown protein [Seminavis robusta]|uniref:Uncharacterized protein n=1 Tax=Seminavis robusta TaxID=568900 RepID=A0A9N8EP84_9STRA|nr:expressed unknown protein [Seminavis robusta]|eukprot:Sro1475_g275850.1 n/a (334) ;mRNA; f:21259-22260
MSATSSSTLYWSTETPIRRHSSYVNGRVAFGSSTAASPASTATTARLEDSFESPSSFDDPHEVDHVDDDVNEEEEDQSSSQEEAPSKATQELDTVDEGDDDSSSTSSSMMDDYEPNLAFLHKTPPPRPHAVMDHMSPERRKHRSCQSRRGGACHSDLLKSAVLATLESYESEPDEDVHRSTSTSLAGDSRGSADNNSRSSRKRTKPWELYEHLQEENKLEDCMLVGKMDVCCKISSQAQRASITSKRRPSLIHTTIQPQSPPPPPQPQQQQQSTATTGTRSAKRPSLVLDDGTMTRAAKRPSLTLQENNKKRRDSLFSGIVAALPPTASDEDI